jgi:membrane protein
MLRPIGKLFMDAGESFMNDHCWRRSASLSYAAVFSIFPLLLLCVAALGFVLGDDESVRERVVASLSSVLTDTSRPLVDDTLHSLQTHRTARGVGVIVGVVTLVFGASGVFSELSTSLDCIWRVPEKQADTTWRAIANALLDKAFSFVVVVVAAIILLALLGLSAAVASIAQSHLGADRNTVVWRVVDALGSVVLMAFVIAALFRIIPHVRVRWKDVALGSIVTSIGLALLKVAFGFYIGGIGSYAAYGVVGAVLALLMWIYVAALVVFFGAELCRAYATQFGSLKARAHA